MKRILLDCDDVLLNWLGGFRGHMEGLLKRDLCEHGPQDWEMHNWLGIKKDAVWPHIEAFNASPAFSHLEPVEGAIDAMNRLQGNALHVITSCSSDQATWDMRYKNLRDHFGPIFQSLTCLDLGKSKKEVLAAYGEDAVWVEDNYKNAMLGVELGQRVYMRRTSHNGQFEAESDMRITWFSHWGELNLESL